LQVRSLFFDVVDAALQWDFGKNDTFEFGGGKWTSMMSQKMGEMRKEVIKSCDWQKKKVSQISASGTRGLPPPAGGGKPLVPLALI